MNFGSKELRLVCTDLDGTLISSANDDPVEPGFFDYLEASRKKNPVAWIIATGRDWASLSDILERKQFPIWPDWVVVLEREIWLIRDKQPVSWYEWNHRCELLHRQLFAFVQPLWKQLEDFIHTHTRAQTIQDPGSPLGIIAQDEEEADFIASHMEDLIGQWPHLTAVRNTIYFRFSHTHYNKGSCLKAISESLGVHPLEILTAGDHYNDLPMLQKQLSHYLICPGNAIAPIKDLVRNQGGYVAEQKDMAGLIQGWDALF